MKPSEAQSTDKQELHEKVAAPSNDPGSSHSDSPDVSTAVELHPSSSSSCLDSGAASQQSGPAMDSSAAMPHHNHSYNAHDNHGQGANDKHTHNGQPEREPSGQQPSREALSPFSKAKAPTVTGEDADIPQVSQPSQGKADQANGPVMPCADSIQPTAGSRKSASPVAKSPSPPQANGDMQACQRHTEAQQASQQSHSPSQAVPTASVPDASVAAPTQPSQRDSATPDPTPQPEPTPTPPHPLEPQATDSQAAPVPPAPTPVPAAQAADTGSLPSGAYMIPYPAAALSASPCTSPVHTPPTQAVSNLQQPASQQPAQLLRPLLRQQQPQQHQQQQQQQQQVLAHQRYQFMLQAHAAQQLQRQASLQRSQSQQQLLQTAQAQQQTVLQSHLAQQQSQVQQQTQVSQQQQAQQQPQVTQQLQAHLLQQQVAQRSQPSGQQALASQQQAGAGPPARQLPVSAVQPRIAQPVWPVPLPRASSGMKRSASGEAAAAAAKKQKTTPLAAYQQAQEHLRNQTTRHGPQSTERTRVAEDMLRSIAPHLGPVLSVPSGFQTSHAKEIELALRSGVHTSVSWSLNALTVLSFSAPQHLLLADQPKLLEALLQVVSSGVEEERGSFVDSDECLTPAERLLPKNQPHSKPGEPQGWWWEGVEGVLAPQPGHGWAFTHACCACNILRNLAMEPRNIPPLTGPAALGALVSCLAARREVPCPDTNDLALNAVDCLHKVTGHQGLQLPDIPPQLHSALLAELCHAMAAHDTPLRVRMSVPGVLQRLAVVPENVAPLAQAAGVSDWCMLERLSGLLRTDVVQAEQQLQQEHAGSCGQADVWAGQLPQRGRLAMAISLQAETLAAAAKAVSELVRFNDQLKQAVAANRHLVVSLIQLLLSPHMQSLDAWHISTTDERLKDGLHRHIYGLFKTALQYATAALINISTVPAVQQRLRMYEMQLLELAMSDSPQADWIAALLNKIVQLSD